MQRGQAPSLPANNQRKRSYQPDGSNFMSPPILSVVVRAAEDADTGARRPLSLFRYYGRLPPARRTRARPPARARGSRSRRAPRPRPARQRFPPTGLVTPPSAARATPAARARRASRRAAPTQRSPAWGGGARSMEAVRPRRSRPRAPVGLRRARSGAVR